MELATSTEDQPLYTVFLLQERVGLANVVGPLLSARAASYSFLFHTLVVVLLSAFMGKTLIPKPHHTRRQIFTITSFFLLCCGCGGLRFGFGERLRVVHCKMSQHHFLTCCSCAALVVMRGSERVCCDAPTRIHKQLVVNQHAVCIICACARWLAYLRPSLDSTSKSANITQEPVKFLFN